MRKHAFGTANFRFGQATKSPRVEWTNDPAVEKSPKRRPRVVAPARKNDTRVIKPGYSPYRVWFGPHNGKLLSDLTPTQLASLAAWIRGKGNDLGWKMRSFLGYVEKELSERDS